MVPYQALVIRESAMLFLAQARTAIADSSHQINAMNTHVIHRIDGVWQPCGDSPIGTSCPNLTVPN
jgi:hypothetical protein